MSKNGLNRVGALWIRKDKNEKSFLAGNLSQGIHGDEIPIMIFKNNKKDKDEQPDYFIFLSGEKGESTPKDAGDVSDIGA